MSGWLSLSSIGGMAIALAFAALATRDLPRGVLYYAVLGVLPIFQVGAFSGNEMVQGIPLAQVLATVLVGVWILQHDRAPIGSLAPFERWLLILLPASMLSIASGSAWLDNDVPQHNVKLSVSIGQVLLFAWPIGVYFVTSRVVATAQWRRQFSLLMLVLAIPQVLALAVPSTKPYVGWSTYFGLIAAPLALARASFEEGWFRKLLWALYLAPPFVEGLVSGKAFLYGYIIVAALVVAWIRMRRVFWLALPAIGFVGVLILMIPEGTTLPGPLQALVETEQSQQSWGGRTGRGQLMADAVSIWSGFPLLGVGPANSYPYMLRYSAIGTPHSQYADILLECGIVGLVVFAAFLVGVIVPGYAALDRPRPQEDQLFLTAWLSSFIAWAVLSITGDYMLHSIRNGGIEMFTGFYIHWVFLGAALGLLRSEAAASEAAITAPARWGRQTVQPVVWSSRR